MIETKLKHIQGKIKAGQGVTSGKGKDEKFPEGTLIQQINYFLK